MLYQYITQIQRSVADIDLDQSFLGSLILVATGHTIYCGCRSHHIDRNLSLFPEGALSDLQMDLPRNPDKPDMVGGMVQEEQDFSR